MSKTKKETGIFKNYLRQLSCKIKFRIKEFTLWFFGATLIALTAFSLNKNGFGGWLYYVALVLLAIFLFYLIGIFIYNLPNPFCKVAVKGKIIGHSTPVPNYDDPNLMTRGFPTEILEIEYRHKNKTYRKTVHSLDPFDRAIDGFYVCRFFPWLVHIKFVNKNSSEKAQKTKKNSKNEEKSPKTERWQNPTEKDKKHRESVEK